MNTHTPGFPGGDTAELVTLVVVAYRQEHLVRDAIASAFAQTYQPLEIILSDDCSPDGTFAVMQEMAANYDGPHRVRLNKNPQNLGLIGHVNRLFELAEGVLIIPNAGDDTSTPDRSAVMYDAFTRRRAPLLHSDYIAMTETGDRLGYRSWAGHVDKLENLFDAQRGMRALLGATCAWSPELYQVFGPITERDAYEDLVFFSRAKLLGGVDHVAQPLVHYRQGGHSRGEKSLEWRAHKTRVEEAVLRQRRRDIETLSLRLLDHVDAAMIDNIERGRRLRRRLQRQKNRAAA